MKKTNTRDMVLVALFTALTAVGAFIKIPVPVVLFTLQFLFTMLAGLVLGGKLGALSVGIYILLGLIGLPIFSQGGGIGYVLIPSFGYLIGFLIASFVTGKIANKVAYPSFKRIYFANFVGLGIVYLIGMTYYYFICKFYTKAPIGIWSLILYCFILAVPGDIVLSILAGIIAKRLNVVMKKDIVVKTR